MIICQFYYFQLENIFSHVGGLGDFTDLEPVDQFSSSLAMFNSPLTSTPISYFNEALPVRDEKPAQGPVAKECKPSTSKAPVAKECKPSTSKEPVAKECKPSTSKPSKNDKSNLGLPLHLPFPDRYSIKVEKAIEAGNVLPVRRQLIADFATFYHGLCSEPLQGDYKRMALKACERFPELKDVTGSSYWV